MDDAATSQAQAERVLQDRREHVVHGAAVHDGPEHRSEAARCDSAHGWRLTPRFRAADTIAASRLVLMT